MGTHDSAVITLFGATGDLAHRKLLPALYRLEARGILHQNTLIFAFARKEKTESQYRAEVLSSLKKYVKGKVRDAVWSTFSKKIRYHRSPIDDHAGYVRLKTKIKTLCKKNPAACNRIFYFAVSSSLFDPIIECLHSSGLSKESKGSWSRVVFEKPFGSDLASAKKLNKTVTKAFEEEQIYRIDHYLGKELVQNLLVLRFANTIFDPIWNKKYIDHVQITVAENIGIGERGSYYDKAGALRDMVQNHMLQLVSLTAMEPPVSLNANDIREEKVKVLRSIRKFTEKDVGQNVVRGQYSSGIVTGERAKGYHAEDGIPKNSRTETFVALKINIDNWRWSGVPFYVRTGKRLNQRVAEINIVFKKNPSVLFKNQANNQPNMLVIRIQPEEGISLQFAAKIPGATMMMDDVRMDFCHECRFGPNSPEAYERLLHDVLVGDQTLFTRWDGVQHAWILVDTIDQHWKKAKKIPTYRSGTWGPAEADKLLARDGKQWFHPQSPMYSSLLK